jgi:type IV secretion system protein TrbC
MVSAKMVVPLLLAVAGVGSVLLSAHPALAATAQGGGLPYESFLTQLRNSITGPVAYTISLLAIVGAGGMLVFGGQQIDGFLRTIVFLVLTIGIVIGANNMMSSFFGQGAMIGAASAARVTSVGGSH